MKSFARAWRMTAIMLVLGLVFFIGRILWANGLFSSVQTGFFGSCRALSSLPGVTDIEIAGGTAFVAVANARGLSSADGIYTLPLSGGRLTRLSGTPRDFHPRGIALYRVPDGSAVLLLAGHVTAQQAPIPVPLFQPDTTWPQSLPNNWVLTNVTKSTHAVSCLGVIAES